MNENIAKDLIHASFFFVDIVGLSNPILSTQTQMNKIKILNESIYACNTFRATPKDELLILPTGDGMLIGFKEGLEQPIKLAIELHKKLRTYNQSVPDTEKITIRIGCNAGYSFVVKDSLGNIDLWGPGIILARRVMDVGDNDHILLTASMYDDLLEVSEHYDKILHPIHDYSIKHGEEILIYSAYEESFGNKKPPEKTIERKEIIRLVSEKNTKCEKIICNIMINDLKKDFVKYERVYYFVNKSNEPIYNINLGITTNTKKEFDELNFKIFEDGVAQKISKIVPQSPFSKEISIKLNSPLFKNDSARIIKIVYSVAEPNNFFENLFLSSTEEFELNLIIPNEIERIEPKLFHIDFKNNCKHQIKGPTKTSKGMHTIFQWQKNDGLNEKDLIRLAWEKNY